MRSEVFLDGGKKFFEGKVEDVAPGSDVRGGAAVTAQPVVKVGARMDEELPVVAKLQRDRAMHGKVAAFDRMVAAFGKERAYAAV